MQNIVAGLAGEVGYFALIRHTIINGPILRNVRGMALPSFEVVPRISDAAI
jgi:hypothetical protein